MPECVYAELAGRITTLERTIRRTRRATIAAVRLSAVAGAVVGGLRVTPVAAQSAGQFLTVRGVTVVDEKGVARVRLGAPLPDPTVMGKQVPRQGVVSGLMIYDADGDERGG